MNLSGRLPVTLLLAAAAALCPIPSSAECHPVVSTFAVGGDGGWDYLAADAAARNLYVTRGSRVTVLDTDGGPAPAATEANSRPRPPMLPGSFEIVVVGP